MSPKRAAPDERAERRALDPSRVLLEQLITDSEHQRQSLHQLQGSATVTNLRTEGMERELRELSHKVDSALNAAEGSPMGRALSLLAAENRQRIVDLERRQDEHGDFITQLRTGLALMKLLVGASLTGTLLAAVATGHTLGWW